MMNYGKFITKVSAFNLFAENADKIIISFMLSIQDVAAFSIISMVAVKLRSFINPIFSVAFPNMVSDSFSFGKMWKKNKEIFIILSLFTIITGLIFYFIIDKVNLLFFGSGYESYYNYSKIFAIFIALTIPIYLIYTYIIAKKLTRALLYARPLYFFIKILISIIFIHFWELLGAVWAYNISAVILFFLYLVLLKERKEHNAVFNNEAI